MSRRPEARCGLARGFAYLGLLFLIFLLGLSAALAGSLWSFQSRRDKERELMFVGREYRLAIARYQLTHANLAQPFPERLEQLLGDGAPAAPRRYIRRLYADPMAGGEWGLLKTPQGGIVAVFSRAQGEPIRRQRAYADEQIDFLNAKTYADWLFGAARPVPQPAEVASPPGPRGDSADEGAPAPPPPPPPSREDG
jgi:type II secretory pathway pseudopilin PulG